MSIDELDGRLHPPSNMSRKAAGKGRDQAAGTGSGRQRRAEDASIAAEAPANGKDKDGASRDGHASAGLPDGRMTKRQKRRRRKAAPDEMGRQGPTAQARPLAIRQGPTDAAPKDSSYPGQRDPATRGRRRRRKGVATAVPNADGEGPLAPPATLREERLEVPVAAVLPVAYAASDDAGRPAVYAALDLGTNNCRLLVAVPTRPGQFRVIDAFSRIVRLGEGLSRTGRLAGPAMDRAIAALTICSQKLAARQVVGARLIATEACRAAANGEEFIERVKRETGLELEIVSRETEARLAVSGCGSLVDRSAKGAVLFDIGGGSSEIALLDLRHGYSRRLSNHIVAWTSLQVGVVTLAERHGGRDVTPELFETMIVEVVEMLMGFAGRDKLDALVGGEHFHLLGTSGTVTTLAGVHLDLDRYDRRQVDGLWLTDVEADELVARIAGWSFEERVANPCIGSDRADLVLAGCAILEAIRRIWPAKRLRVADRGLREGLLTEMMVADGVWRKGAQPAFAGGRQKALA